jgi:hypothetical protein
MIEGIKKLVTAKQAQSQLLGWEGAAKWLTKKEQIKLVEWFMEWMEQSTPKEVGPWWVSTDRSSMNYYITGASIYIVRTTHETDILSSLESGGRHYPYNLHRETNLFINAIVEGLTQYYQKVQAV